MGRQVSDGGERVSRIHIARFPANAGQSVYEVTLGSRHRGRPVAWFRRPATLQVVLRGLRYLDRKRASLKAMAAHLRAGREWATLRASEN